jgi:hypothetical protein
MGPRSGTFVSRSAATWARLRLLARARVSTAIGVYMSPDRMQLVRTPYEAFCRSRRHLSRVELVAIEAKNPTMALAGAGTRGIWAGLSVRK